MRRGINKNDRIESQEIVTSRLILGAQLMTVSVKEAMIMEMGGDLKYIATSRRNSKSSPTRAGVNTNNLYMVPNDSELNTPIDDMVRRDKRMNTFSNALQEVKD